MSNQFKMGGVWGSRIEWFDITEFTNIDARETFRCHGWKSPRPNVGDTLLAEFESSWITFEFVSVHYCDDPADMFFASVRPIKQELK